MIKKTGQTPNVIKPCRKFCVSVWFWAMELRISSHVLRVFTFCEGDLRCRCRMKGKVEKTVMERDTVNLFDRIVTLKADTESNEEPRHCSTLHGWTPLLPHGLDGQKKKIMFSLCNWNDQKIKIRLQKNLFDEDPKQSHIKDSGWVVRCSEVLWLYNGFATLR